MPIWRNFFLGSELTSGFGPFKDPLTHTPVHLLSLDGVGKHYGNIVALTDVTMAVDNGRVTCVLGDNGAGKSTLIKIIAGLHQHTEGTLTVMGEPRTFSSPGKPWTPGSRPSTRTSPSSRSCRSGGTSSSARN